MVTFAKSIALYSRDKSNTSLHAGCHRSTFWGYRMAFTVGWWLNVSSLFLLLLLFAFTSWQMIERRSLHDSYPRTTVAALVRRQSDSSLLFSSYVYLSNYLTCRHLSFLGRKEREESDLQMHRVLGLLSKFL